MLEQKESAIDFSQRLSPERRTAILTAVEDEARKIFNKMPLLPVHDITHVERVVANTGLICKGEGVDSFLPTIAAWLHDIGRLEEIKAKEIGAKVFHAEESAKHIPTILAPFASDLSNDGIQTAKDAVARHSLKNAQDDSVIAIILKDADRLDGMGAIGFPRVFAFYPERPIYSPTEPFGVGRTDEHYLRYSGQSTQLQGFFRNMEWFLWLRTQTAIKLGTPRIKLMIDFLHQLTDELNTPRKTVDNQPIVQKIYKMIGNPQ